MPCSCSREITPKPHSSWPTDYGSHSPLPGFLIETNTGTKRRTKTEDGELYDAIAISPQASVRGGVLILAATISLFPLLDGDILGPSYPLLNGLWIAWPSGKKGQVKLTAETGGRIGGGMGQLAGFQFLSGDPSQGLLLRQNGLGGSTAKHKPTSCQSIGVARHCPTLSAVGRV